MTMTFEQQLAKAQGLAEDYHTNHTKTGRPQKYGGSKPYTFHLRHVSDVLRDFGYATGTEYGQRLHLAAWLHDIVEDTTFNINQVEAIFGKEVRDLVWAVTNEEGENRKARHATVIPKLNALPDAMILKLADRIANVVQSCADVVEAEQKNVKKDHKMGMYIKEWKAFEEHLGSVAKQAAPKMWAYLEKLMTDRTFRRQEGLKRLVEISQS